MIVTIGNERLKYSGVLRIITKGHISLKIATLARIHWVQLERRQNGDLGA